MTEGEEYGSCVSFYSGKYQNEYATAREIVAVHTARAALLRLPKLLECVRDVKAHQHDLSHGVERYHLIIDEADHCDVWMTLLIAAGRVLHQRGLVKLWIMSATLDLAQVDGCRDIDLGLFHYPVRVVSVLLEDPKNYKHVASELAVRTARKGTCTLVFLPGREDTENVAAGLRECREAATFEALKDSCILKNHGGSSKADNAEVLLPPLPQEWKVVAATERLSRSVTAPNSAVVVDTHRPQTSQPHECSNRTQPDH